MGVSLVKVVALDRFVVPAAALGRLSSGIKADVTEGIRAANAGCRRAGTVMLRRALERACTEAGASDATLNQKILSLSKAGVLSPLQASTAHAIRAFANKYGAHPDDDLLEEVSDEEIEGAVKLTIAVIEGLAKRASTPARRSV